MKAVKAWAILRDNELRIDYSNDMVEIYTSKEEAEYQISLPSFEKIIRVKITKDK